jgi:hypothetical protein
MRAWRAGGESKHSMPLSPSADNKPEESEGLNQGGPVTGTLLMVPLPRDRELNPSSRNQSGSSAWDPRFPSGPLALANGVGRFSAIPSHIEVGEGCNGPEIFIRGNDRLCMMLLCRSGDHEFKRIDGIPGAGKLAPMNAA